MNDNDGEKIDVVPECGAHQPVIIDSNLCTGCNHCVNACPADLFLPAEERGRPPRVVFAGECWYEGSCVNACPVKGAIRLQPPLFTRVHWRPRPPGS